MTTIRLTLDKATMEKLEDLQGFEGEETIEDTLRLLIRYAHADMRRIVDKELGPNGEKARPLGSQADNELPF